MTKIEFRWKRLESPNERKRKRERFAFANSKKKIEIKIKKNGKNEWKRYKGRVKKREEGMKSKPERIKLTENLATGGKSNSHARLGREKSFLRNWRGRELVTSIPRSHNGE